MLRCAACGKRYAEPRPAEYERTTIPDSMGGPDIQEHVYRPAYGCLGCFGWLCDEKGNVTVKAGWTALDYPALDCYQPENQTYAIRLRERLAAG